VHPFLWGSFQHILIEILTTVLLGPSLHNGYLLTTSLQKAVQSRRVRGEQAQLLCTRSGVVMQGFRSCFSCFSCTRTPFFAQTTHRVFTWTTDSEVDTSGLNDGSLHLIVRYWTLQQLQVRRTKTRAVVAIKVVCLRAEIKIPQPVPLTLYSRTLDRE